MCKYINKLLCNSSNNKQQFTDNIMSFIIKHCECDECNLNYKKVIAVIKIRKFIRNHCKNNIKHQKLKSISDTDIVFNSKFWMNEYYNKLNNLNTALQFII